MQLLELKRTLGGRVSCILFCRCSIFSLSLLIVADSFRFEPVDRSKQSVRLTRLPASTTHSPCTAVARLANETFNSGAGDAIYLQSGDVWNEPLVVKGSDGGECSALPGACSLAADTVTLTPHPFFSHTPVPTHARTARDWHDWLHRPAHGIELQYEPQQVHRQCQWLGG